MSDKHTYLYASVSTNYFEKGYCNKQSVKAHFPINQLSNLSCRGLYYAHAILLTKISSKQQFKCSHIRVESTHLFSPSFLMQLKDTCVALFFDSISDALLPAGTIQSYLFYIFHHLRLRVSMDHSTVIFFLRQFICSLSVLASEAHKCYLHT